MAAKGTIRLEWRTNGKEEHKNLNKEDFYSLFEGLANTFRDENEISKKFMFYIPQADILYINNDVNGTKDKPIVVFQKDDPDLGRLIVGIVEIIRYHKVIWTVLYKLMDQYKPLKPLIAETLNGFPEDSNR